MEIRKARPEELPELLSMYARARTFMAEHGNPTQWGTTDPPDALIEQDVRQGKSYVCLQEGCIAAVFFFDEGPDPTYRVIENGAWLDEGPYSVVHRITSNGTVRGAAGFCLEWALSQCGSLRIDTHKDNLVMQNLLKKNGFSYCGIIHVENGSPRLAYQKLAAASADKTARE